MSGKISPVKPKIISRPSSLDVPTFNFDFKLTEKSKWIMIASEKSIGKKKVYINFSQEGDDDKEDDKVIYRDDDVEMINVGNEVEFVAPFHCFIQLEKRNDQNWVTYIQPLTTDKEKYLIYVNDVELKEVLTRLYDGDKVKIGNGRGTLCFEIIDKSERELIEYDKYSKYFKESTLLKSLDHNNIVKVLEDHININLDRIFIWQEMLYKDLGEYLNVIDFGEAINYKLETSNSIYGTLLYLPPEIHKASYFNRNNLYKPSVDIWAFGIISYKMLTGKHPYFTDYAGEIDDYSRIADYIEKTLGMNKVIPKESLRNLDDEVFHDKFDDFLEDILDEAYEMEKMED
ncbi:kinase-like domain-containing protein [Glomus cerebriforme]|uniref:Kinase-like domain-containing protein n=1 Tax=Glomus cerebriforme TaxID=658196 RepID=A0A397TFY7_9GLOM|nr:kinase-like domain-containing protein [Glomus cerebriforme]